MSCDKLRTKWRPLRSAEASVAHGNNPTWGPRHQLCWYRLHPLTRNLMTLLLKPVGSGNSLTESRAEYIPNAACRQRLSKMKSAAAPIRPPASPFIERLPNELLVHILGFLDSPSNIQGKLCADPTKISRPVDSGIDKGIDTPIKNASLVCHLWRRSGLQLLFRHVVWSFQRFYKPADGDIASHIEVLDFLQRNGLSKDVESFTILIDPPKGMGYSRYADGEPWGLLPPEKSPLQPPMSYNPLSPVLSQPPQASLTDRPRSVNGPHAREAYTAARPHWDNNWLWHTIFGQLDPLRITLISSADIISSLLSRGVDLRSQWAFNSHCHILSLSRTSRFLPHQGDGAALAPLPSNSPGPRGTSVPSDLFSIRDWTSLLVNEGSFIPVYSAYEFFHYSAPTLLPVILNPADESFDRLQNNLRSFSYIGIFPLSRHIRDFLLPYCPPVENLFIQLMPTAIDFWDSGRFSHIDITDLWLECDTAYSLVMREVFDRDVQSNWKKLRVFESGDASSEEAWNMAMQYVQVHGLNGWTMKREGYFVREAGRA